jgi:organic hydroperoxide reductase OsmC/OhrA
MTRFDFVLTTADFMRLRIKDAYPLPRVDDTLNELKDANFYTHIDLGLSLRITQIKDQASTAMHKNLCIKCFIQVLIHGRVD